MSDLLIEAAHVVVDADTVWSPGWVEVTGQCISAVGEGVVAEEQRSRAREVIVADSGAVTPGFINAHTHLFQTFLRGLRDDLAHAEWNALVIGANVGRFTEEDFYLAALLGATENLLAGCTTIVENHYVHTSPQNTDRIAQALVESGIRAWLARGTMDRSDVVAQASGPEAARACTESAEQSLAELDRIAGAWHGMGGGRLQVAAAVQAAWGSSGELLERLSAYADAGSLLLHAHCAETLTTDGRAHTHHGCSELDALARHGFVGAGTQLVHGVWFDDEAIGTVAGAGAGVVHCPVSNAYLGSGIAPIGKLRSAGVPIALASDGSASNHRQDPFEAMKVGALMQRAVRREPSAMLPVDMLEMSWKGGAQVLGASRWLGRLAPGSAADVVVVDLSGAHVQPLHDVRSMLVLSTQPADVRHVLVNGRVCVRNGRSTMVDLDELTARCRRRVEQLRLAERAHSPAEALR